MCFYTLSNAVTNPHFRSAFVGLATILLLFPIPGYVAKRIQEVQVVRLKATDARVQTVTESRFRLSIYLTYTYLVEAMNVLRMIKLFGWEKKMNEKVAEKRDKELVWIWKRQILDLINGNLKYIISISLFCDRTLTKSTVFLSQLQLWSQHTQHCKVPR